MAESSDKIFVGGLPRNCSQEVFTQYFEQFGNITDVVVMKDRETGESRGFGFVTYESAAIVDRVIEKASEHKIQDKWVDVKRATPKGSMPDPGTKGRSGGGKGSPGGGKDYGGAGKGYGGCYGGGGPYDYGMSMGAYGGYGGGYGGSYGGGYGPYGGYGGGYGGYSPAAYGGPYGGYGGYKGSSKGGCKGYSPY
mmetsp:Transcript_48265/g.149057  ORF Transcript_48265/g.149057 Transcript_48265/m.149057 type:complete len:194 (+) Transcript_48265:48-629(+)